MSSVVGLGAGGHGKVVVAILRLHGNHEVRGLLDPDERLWDTSVAGVPVLGADSLLPELRDEGVDHAFIGAGSTGDLSLRKRLYDLVRETGMELIEAIHPNAVIDSTAKLGAGLTAMAGAIVNPEARLGDNVIVNTGSLVEHDCDIGDHVHIASGAHLAGAVRVGEMAHVGLGADVCEGLTVGAGSIVGAGAVVVQDVEPRVVVAGVPARIIRRRDT